jgi:hypothetical protein
MDGIGNFISMMDYILDTKRKRHITGGILLSASLLFGGLAAYRYDNSERGGRR